MEIDKMIDILQTAKNCYGASHVKILRTSDDFSCDYIAEDIAGYSYSDIEDYIIFFSEYI